ncbi:hypothetical protein [Cellulomonas sp. Y8]|uniref:hypothetical protein n=1 Tax=Cellulomonas sp. Y8 TaxID=2591145 RepID=UPI0011C824B7|nr:hypothetical protein [Cellulomonas sp. Y8]
MSAGQPAAGDVPVDPRDLRTAQRWRRSAHVLSAVVLAIVALGVVGGFTNAYHDFNWGPLWAAGLLALPVAVTGVVLGVRSNRLVPDDAAFQAIVVAVSAVVLALMCCGPFLLWLGIMAFYRGY